MAGGAAPSRLLLGGKRVDLGQTIDPAVIGCNGDPGVLWGGHWWGLAAPSAHLEGGTGVASSPLFWGRKRGNGAGLVWLGLLFLWVESRWSGAKRAREWGEKR